MGWFIFKHIFSTLFSFIRIGRLSDHEKDLEILPEGHRDGVVLRQQLSILQRKLDHPIRPSRVEKMTLAVLTTKIKQVSHRATDQLQDVIRIFQPETILRWHGELVRRKWTYPKKNKGGRPTTSKEIESLILRLARENSRWGYGKIQGELRKLSFRVSETSIRNILDRQGSLGWQHLMNHYREQILACDFFTVETILLQTIYVFFFIEISSRRVHFAGITTNPNQFWVTQQARQLVWELSNGDISFRFLIHDNDRSLCMAFDLVFKSEGLHVINTPLQAPNANSFAERWVRTVREECLDLILIFNAAHLRRVMLEFVDYNSARPHQGIQQQSPIAYHFPASGSIQCRNILGGIIHDYFRDPTWTTLSSA